MPISSIPNGVSGLTFRTTMNDNFTALDNEKSATTHNHTGVYAPVADVSTNTTDIAALDVRVTDNEADIVTLQSPADAARLNPVATGPAHVEGQFYYNSNTGTFNIQGPYPGIEVSPGHGEHLHVINNSGAVIEAGMAVRINGVAAGIPQIVKAQADTFENANVIGITTIDVPD